MVPDKRRHTFSGMNVGQVPLPSPLCWSRRGLAQRGRGTCPARSLHAPLVPVWCCEVDLHPSHPQPSYPEQHHALAVPFQQSSLISSFRSELAIKRRAGLIAPARAVMVSPYRCCGLCVFFVFFFHSLSWAQPFPELGEPRERSDSPALPVPASPLPPGKASQPVCFVVPLCTEETLTSFCSVSNAS